MAMASSSSRHPSVTPFSLATAPAPVGIASPKRPPLVLNKDNPAEAALSRKLNALTNDLQRKEEQIASLNDKTKSGGMRQQYDKLVGDLIKQQEVLKGKHVELHKKLEESNVRFILSVACSPISSLLIFWHSWAVPGHHVGQHCYHRSSVEQWLCH